MVLYSFIASLFTWGLTALGSATVLFFKKINKNIMDGMLGFAGGVMIASSFFSLLNPAISYAEEINIPLLIVVCGFFMGGLLLFCGDKYYENKINTSSNMKRIIMLIFSITLHNIPEGMAIGVSFGSGDIINSIALAIGIGIQNLPEGIAVSVPLLREGYSRRKSFFIGQLSGIVEPIGAILGCLLVLKIKVLLPFILSFAAGAMIYVVITEIIPTSQSNESKNIMTLYTMIGFTIMMMLDILL